MEKHQPTGPDQPPDDATGSTSRRDFLQQAAGLTAGIAALSPAAPAAESHRTTAPTLPTVPFGPHRITRLIVGGNPIYGYSHFNKHFDRHLTAWHTPERVLELWRRCEQAGINTFQNSYAERTLNDVDHYRAAGGSMQWLCLGKPDWDEHPEHIADAARHKPIGIAPHGALNERLHRQKKYDVLTGLLKRIRDQGVLVGLSAHDPTLIEEAGERDWDVDYFMCSLYYLTRPKDEYRTILGANLPLGEIYLPTDPPRMFKAIQTASKPCLAYKVLAAGRRVGNPAEVRRCFEEAFAQIKPSDAVIVGMYQQFGDQVGEDTALVREIASHDR
jgi:hypothetical protein